MSATGTDRRNVQAQTRRDAEDKARRRWEEEGFRVIAILDAVPTAGQAGTYRVTAEIAVRR